VLFRSQPFLDEQGNPLPEIVSSASNSFWQTAIESEDQLRQRMAFALSQILVISNLSDLFRVPQTVAASMDILTEGALGYCRDLLHEVTYSPAMAVSLAYLRYEQADPLTGRVPDENYARELLQLFTIGLVELAPDGTPVTDAGGQPIELFNNDTITGLAKVFTGLSPAGAAFNAPQLSLPQAAYYQPLVMFDDFHSLEEKQFLGTTIAAGPGGDDSISMALDAIFAHPNVGPFLARQLIQRFVTSAPPPDYVSRVASAFDTGSFTLPSGAEVGDGRRGDLTATLAAILFDEVARGTESLENPQYGKLREPVIRFHYLGARFQGERGGRQQ